MSWIKGAFRFTDTAVDRLFQAYGDGLRLSCTVHDERLGEEWLDEDEDVLRATIVETAPVVRGFN